mgnify:CR=1 FL=1
MCVALPVLRSRCPSRWSADAESTAVRLVVSARAVMARVCSTWVKCVWPGPPRQVTSFTSPFASPVKAHRPCAWHTMLVTATLDASHDVTSAGPDEHTWSKQKKRRKKKKKDRRKEKEEEEEEEAEQQQEEAEQQKKIRPKEGESAWVEEKSDWKNVIHYCS